MCSLRSRISGTDGPAPIWRQHDFPNWIRRAEGHSPDGAIRLRAEGAASKFSLRDATVHAQPLFSSQPTLYTVLGNPAQGGEGATVSGTKSNGNMKYNSLQAVLQKQMTSRFAVSGLLYVLQVHVGQHGLLRSVEQCPQCLGILAERLRSERGVGAMLLRCHARHFSLCGLRPSLWAWQSRLPKTSNKVVDAVIGGWAGQPHRRFPHRLAIARLGSSG